MYEDHFKMLSSKWMPLGQFQNQVKNRADFGEMLDNLRNDPMQISRKSKITSLPLWKNFGAKDNGFQPSDIIVHLLYCCHNKSAQAVERLMSNVKRQVVNNLASVIRSVKDWKIGGSTEGVVQDFVFVDRFGRMPEILAREIIKRMDLVCAGVGIDKNSDFPLRLGEELLIWARDYPEEAAKQDLFVNEQGNLILRRKLVIYGPVD